MQNRRNGREHGDERDGARFFEPVALFHDEVLGAERREQNHRDKRETDAEKREIFLKQLEG